METKLTEYKPIQITGTQTATEVAPKEIFTTAKHCANIGDVIAALPAVKRYWEVTKRRIQFLQLIDMEGHYYAGASHPTKSADGRQVTMNMPMFEMLKPLVESQPYIHSFVPYVGQKVDLNFDVIRGQTDVGMPNFAIQSWLMFAFPDLAYDISKTWIDLPEDGDEHHKNMVQDKIIINFTERYRNGLIDYFFLQNYQPDLIFAGTEQEHFLFCSRWNLNEVPRLNVGDFLQYAYILKHCRFLMSNQSMAWNLSTAVGGKRILEVCKYAPNCQPYIGEDSYGYFYQVGAEYYFRKLYNETHRNNR